MRDCVALLYASGHAAIALHFDARSGAVVLLYGIGCNVVGFLCDTAVGAGVL